MAKRSIDTPDALELEFERLLRFSPTATRSSASRTTSSGPSNGAQVIEATCPTVITLDVAGRLFKVSTHILIAESGLFQRRLSDRFTWTPQCDGTYFLDTDPTLFAHLLRFMRRPSVFPLFWSKDQGFDYDLYQRLQEEAEYFQMDPLYQWIKDKKYLDAITIHTYQPRTRKLDDITSETISGTMSEDWHYVTKIRKTYVCPRGIPVHYGNRNGCGRACREYQGDHETEYDEKEYLEVVSVRKEIVFDEAVCQMA